MHFGNLQHSAGSFLADEGYEICLHSLNQQSFRKMNFTLFLRKKGSGRMWIEHYLSNSYSKLGIIEAQVLSSGLYCFSSSKPEVKRILYFIHLAGGRFLRSHIVEQSHWIQSNGFFWFWIILDWSHSWLHFLSVIKSWRASYWIPPSARDGHALCVHCLLGRSIGGGAEYIGARWRSESSLSAHVV